MNNLTVLESNIDKHSEDFINNFEKNKTIVNGFKFRLQQVIDHHNGSAAQKHKAQGKLLAFERIEHLIDKDTPFLELSTLAACDQYDNQFPSAGIITGIGHIHGKETVIIANDATVKGGTYVKETIKKHLRAQEIALENNLPCVYLVESGGIFLQQQAEVFADKEHFGRIFYNQAKLSAASIPQIAVVLGSCTAGGAYIPAMSDESIIVRNQGTIFLAGPPLVKAATGEEVTSEELGGAYVHTTISGVADHIADNDQHAMEICRNIFSTFTLNKKQDIDKWSIEEPLYKPEELYGILQADSKKSVNAYEIIARIVDGSKFQEFKSNYGQTLITGYARIMGYPVGILANNGILFSESALKGTHFIELCCHRNIPIVFLQNITGFIVGKEYEHKGIAKDGAKMVHAVATANVPKFTIIFGGSHGAGNYAMSGRAFSPNLLFTWPNSRTSVMGGEQASEVLAFVKQKPKENGKQSLQDANEFKKKVMEKYESESSAYYSTSRLWDDGIIDPIDTRVVLAIGISMSLNKKFSTPKTGIFRM